jgi:hypothetical protein
MFLDPEPEHWKIQSKTLFRSTYISVSELLLQWKNLLRTDYVTVFPLQIYPYSNDTTGTCYVHGYPPWEIVKAFFWRNKIQKCLVSTCAKCTLCSKSLGYHLPPSM